MPPKTEGGAPGKSRNKPDCSVDRAIRAIYNPPRLRKRGNFFFIPPPAGTKDA